MKRKKRPAALVTGGARRIGRTIALALAEDGFDIALHYRESLKDVAKVAKTVRACGADCDIFPADFEREGEADEMLRGVLRRFPRLRILVNSASLFIPSGMTRKDLPLLERHWSVHVKAPWSLAAGFVDGVKTGAIINLLDTHVLGNRTAFPAYLLSKKSLAELTKMQAVSFAPRIRVNAVAPGLILPPEGLDTGYLMKRAKGVPLQRQGSPKDVVAAVRFLVTNAYVTGQTIFVDGGEHLL